MKKNLFTLLITLFLPLTLQSQPEKLVFTPHWIPQAQFAGYYVALDQGFYQEADRLEITLTDSGKPFDPTASPDPDISLSAEDRPIGGLGIFLMRKLMDEVHYERQQNLNILTLRKKYNKPQSL